MLERKLSRNPELKKQYDELCRNTATKDICLARGHKLESSVLFYSASLRFKTAKQLDKTSRRV